MKILREEFNNETGEGLSTIIVDMETLEHYNPMISAGLKLNSIIASDIVTIKMSCMSFVYTILEL